MKCSTPGVVGLDGGGGGETDFVMGVGSLYEILDTSPRLSKKEPSLVVTFAWLSKNECDPEFLNTLETSSTWLAG